MCERVTVVILCVSHSDFGDYRQLTVCRCEVNEVAGSGVLH